MLVYPTEHCSVNSRLSGRYLAHNRLNAIGRAFLAVDLFDGAKMPVDFTMTQAAHLARANITSAWWAKRRQAERAAIEASLVPLVPARMPVPKTNGCVLPAIASAEIDDAELITIARIVGQERMLAAAVAVEAAQ